MPNIIEALEILKEAGRERIVHLQALGGFEQEVAKIQAAIETIDGVFSAAESMAKMLGFPMPEDDV